jgi:transcriptional regulator with XRE-family HTH domain
MEDIQVGSIIRAVRIRRGMSQTQVAAAAGVSRAMVSLIEYGDLERTSLCAIRRVAGEMDV